MGRLIAISIVCLGMTGCTIMSAASAIQGSVVDTIAHLFQGTDVSIPKDAPAALAAAQQGLRKLSLDVDVLEPVDGGYEILLGNEKLNGHMKIRPDAKVLTTVFVRVREGVGRRTAIEKAVIDAVREQSENPDAKKEFDMDGYLPLYKTMKEGTKQAGWYRRGGWVEVAKVGEGDWLQLKLPSGEKGYLHQPKVGVSIPKDVPAASVEVTKVGRKNWSQPKPPSREKGYLHQPKVDVSIPKDVPAALAAAQQSLRKLALDVDVLEPVDGGYDILLGNKKLDGHMKIRPETKELTTVFVRVREGVGRRTAIEKAVIDAMREQSENPDAKKEFDMDGYLPLYKTMKEESKQVGWYRRGAWVTFIKVGGGNWFQLKLPSGKKGYLHKPEAIRAGK